MIVFVKTWHYKFQISRTSFTRNWAVHAAVVGWPASRNRPPKLSAASPSQSLRLIVIWKKVTGHRIEKIVDGAMRWAPKSHWKRTLTAIVGWNQNGQALCICTLLHSELEKHHYYRVTSMRTSCGSANLIQCS